MASDTSGSSEGWRVDTINLAWCQLPGGLCDADPHSHSHTYADGYRYTDDDTYTNAHCQAPRNTQTTSYTCAATSTVTYLFESAKC